MAKNNSIKEVVHFLKQNPFSTERDICGNVWGFYRERSIFSNKKYADMIRRGLDAKKIQRISAKVDGIRSTYFYYVPR